MQSICLAEVRAGLVGSPYSKLIEYHLKKQTDSTREFALQGTIQLLPDWFRPWMEGLIDEWSETGRYSGFWQTDCAVVFDHILQSARNVVAFTDNNINDDDLFNIFQVITLNFASMASQHRELRKFARIRKGFFG